MNLPVKGENLEYAAENDLVLVRTHTSSHLVGAGETPAKIFCQIKRSKSRAEQQEWSELWRM